MSESCAIQDKVSEDTNWRTIRLCLQIHCICQWNTAIVAEFCILNGGLKCDTAYLLKYSTRNVGSVHAWNRYIYVVFFCFSFYFFNIPVDAKPTDVDLKEDFEDTKGAIRFRISKKNRQHNGQEKKYKRANNDLHNIHIKLKIEQHEPH